MFQQQAASSKQQAASSKQQAASSKRWATVETERSVLFVARTLQAAVRLHYDVSPLLRQDRRLQTYYTVDETTEFVTDTQRFLDRQQVKQIPWNHAAGPAFDCDLTVSASANANLHELPGRKLVMSHGAGQHKYRASPTGHETASSGSSREQLTFDGEVIPDVIALGGRDQYQRLVSHCPEAREHAELTGDVCAERIHLSSAHRSRYRHALNVRPEHRLIVLTSTWGSESLLARCPELPKRLLESLPCSEYRVAMVLHPNCWDAHQRPDIDGWLEGARRAGLKLIPPEEGWRATVVAADCVIADHGSVGFYAADAGRPLLLATFGHHEVPVDSPAALLSRRAPRLDSDADLPSQIDAAIDSHVSDRYRDITAMSLRSDGSPAVRLRRTLYRLLDLPEAPLCGHPEPLPAPEPRGEPATSQHVYPVYVDGELRVTSYPFANAAAARHRDLPSRILTVDAREPDTRRLDYATVSTWTESPLSLDEAEQYARDQLASLPGVDIVACDLTTGDAYVHSRQKGGFVAVSRARLDLACLGAAVYHVMTTGALGERLRYREGRREVTILLKPDEI